MGKIPVSKVRKGYEILVNGIRVRVSKKEKWSKSTRTGLTRYKLHFEDCGNGLPTEGHASAPLTITSAMVESDVSVEFFPKPKKRYVTHKTRIVPIEQYSWEKMMSE